MKKAFIAIDGDDVGRQLEYFMLLNEKDTLHQFSITFQNAMDSLKEKLTNGFNADIIFHGGDNLLAEFDENNLTVESIEKLRSVFAQNSKCTLSIGLGHSIHQAYFALKLAKASGKNCLRDFKELSHE